MVNLRLLQAPLPGFVIKECEYFVERLIRIIHHVRKRPSLSITQEFIARQGNGRHSWAGRDLGMDIGIQITIYHLQKLYLQIRELQVRFPRSG